jgi:hypothetical protein
MWVPVRLDFDLTREGQASIPTKDWRAHSSMLYQNSDFSAAFAVSVGGTPVDFSGRTWAMRIWDKAQNQEVLSLDNSSITGDNTGRITISIAAATTAALLLGTPTRYLNSIALSDYVYSLDATDSAGGMVRVAEGIFVISHDIE